MFLECVIDDMNTISIIIFALHIPLVTPVDEQPASGKKEQEKGEYKGSWRIGICAIVRIYKNK